MYPGLTDADCQVADFRRRERQLEAQRRRIGADARTETSPAAPGAVRSWLESLLVRAGRVFAGRARHLPADRLGSAH